MPNCSEQQDNELCASVLSLAKDCNSLLYSDFHEGFDSLYRYPDTGKGLMPILVWLMGCGFQPH
jgi:hypothetical protein